MNYDESCLVVDSSMCDDVSIQRQAFFMFNQGGIDSNASVIGQQNLRFFFRVVHGKPWKPPKMI